jgi:hypothetical protein
MNANKMADLMILFDSGRIYEHAEEIATMLRQQQAEIEALKEKVKQNADLEEKADLCKEKLAPVAWMQVHYKDNKPTKFSKVQTWEDDVPLYTHPVDAVNTSE